VGNDVTVAVSLELLDLSGQIAAVDRLVGQVGGRLQRAAEDDLAGG
jgi:hypothetical protein